LPKRELQHTALIIALAFAVTLGCWNTGFLDYDDGLHIRHPLVISGSFSDLFRTPKESTYFPITILSYRIDTFFFGNSAAFATEVRLMNALFHAVGALFLWRVFRLLKFSDNQSLFAAAVFAAHPLACESVCWISERKNVLAGAFGFAGLYAYLKFSDRSWRYALTALLYGLAILSKPSALGLLPLFFAFEFGQRYFLPNADQTPSPITRRLLFLISLALFSGFTVHMTILGSGIAMVPPPGGSVFTALLTDVEIYARYISNILAPVRLSFIYFVNPIVSIGDGRLLLYGGMLLVLVVSTIWIAQNRFRSVLGWFWFFAALGPSANIVALPQAMEDRYIYFSTPGLLIVLVESTAGITQRAATPARIWRVLAGVYVGMLALLAISRSTLFSNSVPLFRDAVQKEPLAAHARYGLWFSSRNAEAVLRANLEHGDADRIERLRRDAKESAVAFVDKCPDNIRQLNYQEMTISAGDYCLHDEETAEAERYFKLVIDPPLPYLDRYPQIKSEALLQLAQMEFDKKEIEKSYELCGRAVKAFPDYDKARFIKASAGLRLAESIRSSDGPRAAGLLSEAKSDFESVPEGSHLYRPAQAALQRVGQLQRSP
jgi:hypothetical protein